MRSNYHHAALRQDGTLHSVGVSRRNIRCTDGGNNGPGGWAIQFEAHKAG